jgi:hypothetical protein
MGSATHWLVPTPPTPHRSSPAKSCGTDGSERTIDIPDPSWLYTQAIMTMPPRERVALTVLDQLEVQQEKRHSPRFAWVVGVRGSFLTPLEMPEEESSFSLEGVTENVGRAGVCVLCDRPLPPTSVLRCEFELPGKPVRIPTLMQVRWSVNVEGKRQCKVGLQFLL